MQPIQHTRPKLLSVSRLPQCSRPDPLIDPSPFGCPTRMGRKWPPSLPDFRLPLLTDLHLQSQSQSATNPSSATPNLLHHLDPCCSHCFCCNKSLIFTLLKIPLIGLETNHSFLFPIESPKTRFSSKRSKLCATRVTNNHNYNELPPSN